MATIGFIGLGVMGRPMASNLIAAGHHVVGTARSASTLERAAQAGIPVERSLADAIGGADLVITMLPDSPDVERVALGPGGILEHIAPGAAYIDMSTISPGVARSVATAFGDAGHPALDAPVSGGEAGAIEGTLSIMIGGDAAVIEEQRGVLAAMGSTITHVGPAGAGQVVKAANQLIVAAHLQALAEAVMFLESQDADVEAALTAVSRGLAGSTVIDRKVAGVLAGEFEPGFRLELHHKDLRIVADAAAATGTLLPITRTVTGFVADLVAAGGGGLDHSALVLHARELNRSELS
ncbi:NAD(P)-binding domain-containing protein [Microbacterium sp. M28]|uniref:NAD(P)-dependent oxidoreductase n=1 Tax=Microbacterium sp. M28 TaxID=2962064 RepID=UPI0021F4ABF8|nr:NAD(P)-binding domain-containing protein [Microbacterium sp. M28]UYO97384.1 NAD(P)-binding domain-containing protein [Microbacterium sp. M28]